MRKNNLFALLMTVLFLSSSMLAGCTGQGKNQEEKGTGSYPEKPINMIIAFTAGGSSDAQARIMQKYWNKYVKQPWLFSYKAGDGGAIGFAEIAKASKDGYTIGGINVPHIVLQPLQGAQYKPEEFAYIAQVVTDPQVLVVKKGSKFKNVNEVVEFARANPGKLKVGIVGTFTGCHIALLDFQDKAGIQVDQVVYKGATDQNVALLGGELDVMMGNYNDVMRGLDQMTILGIATPERYKSLPEVPTLTEQGYNVVSDIRRGFVAPKGIPEANLTFLRKVFKKMAADPDYIKEMEEAGQPQEYLDGPAFEKYVMEQQKQAERLLMKFHLI
ncbi:tripartite tricarboxylate transporter substrate binding protein [Desulforamulus ruminis]|uniref:Tripartite-type tricarboxylate transporter, receptor component TctC n=1 Tax=Desulforamulus ruminis (strain ATCC 23193 / DSM 2154 / NCIMB 8452 / DL) TaxID=696281 RepID=F6DSX2_DESRL|nr:tripartite tricarboxylate transporter substrate binding protein [Desulforamulus ruminis]AEG59966.1 hypothetical protein Desru_1702 [Desulforamulus ruminis DSM 2154]